MSGKGNCYDNAAVETFFKTIKAELIWRDTWETHRSTLGWKSPVSFERKVA
ncbi:MAG: putative transposase [Paracoccaceae bacterium]|jgi:putative transposase